MSQFTLIIFLPCVTMDRWKGQVAIVTGASSGIGAEIVSHLVDHGLKVVGLARRKERLEELEQKCIDKQGIFYYFVADIGKEEDVVNAFLWVKENVGVVNILVNNAGVARFSTLMEGNSQHIRETLDTNVFGLCITTREALKEMQNNKIDGHIIHINSVAGHKVERDNIINVYPASKFAITALTETLRNELSLIDSKIKVSSISPGFVETGIVDASMRESGYAEDMLKAYQVNKLVQELPALQVKDIADVTIYVLSTPPHVQIHDIIIRPVGEK